MTEPIDFVQLIVNAVGKRDAVHRKATNFIAQQLEFVFEAIVEFLGNRAPSIEWDSIEVAGELLVITASIPSPETRQQRMVSVGVPFSVLQQQTKAAVLEFFNSSESSRRDYEEIEEIDEGDDEDDEPPQIMKRVLH